LEFLNSEPYYASKKNCQPVVRFSGMPYRLVPSQKKHWLQASEMFAKLTLALAQNCRVHFAKSSLNTCVPVNSSTLQSRDELTILFKHRCDDTHTQPFNGPLSGTTQVGQYQKKHSSTHNHPHHQTSFINFLYLVRRHTGST